MGGDGRDVGELLGGNFRCVDICICVDLEFMFACDLLVGYCSSIRNVECIFFVYYYNHICESFRVFLLLLDTFRGRLSTRIYSVRPFSAILAMADQLPAI